MTETDASNLGLSAILYQYQERRKVAIAYASRRLHRAEQNDRNYSSMNLLGSKLTIITDNNPLCHLTTAKLGAIEQNGHLSLLFLISTLCTVPGRCNTAADALSRWPGLGKVEPKGEDQEYDGCVALCNSLRMGTILGPDLVAAGIEGCQVWHLQASGATEDDGVCGNTSTLPGYSKVPGD